MVTIIICVIIGIIGVLTTIDDFDIFDFMLFGLFIGGLIGVLCGFVIALALPAKLELVKTSYNLEALQDNNSVSGKFFLGSGNIESKMKYVFYYNDDDYFRLKQVDYSLVKIKYSDEKPKAECFTYEPVKDVLINYFALDYPLDAEYIIHVPKGTIKQNYSLDAQ